MPRPAPRHPTPAPLALALAAAVLAPAAGAGDVPQDPWALLVEARERMVAAGAQRSEFRQTYVPAGFETGDEEVGAIAVDLPGCLRWDYVGPYPRTYLLCHGVLHHWVHGEETGRRGAIDPREEPGLDLLLLDTDELARRYRADLSGEAPQRPSVVLLPLDEAAPLTRARLDFDAELTLRRLSFRDREGNITRFDLGRFRPLADRALFEPPPDIAWREP